MTSDDPTELPLGAPHPASRSAYRRLKGFFISNAVDYQRYNLAMQRAAASRDLQATVCLGTIDRLAAGQPVSDRYLLGLAWTILSIHNKGELEAIAEKRLDRAYGESADEFILGAGDES